MMLVMEQKISIHVSKMSHLDVQQAICLKSGKGEEGGPNFDKKHKLIRSATLLIHTTLPEMIHYIDINLQLPGRHPSNIQPVNKIREKRRLDPKYSGRTVVYCYEYSMQPSDSWVRIYWGSTGRV